MDLILGYLTLFFVHSKQHFTILFGPEETLGNPEVTKNLIFTQLNS